MSEIRVRCAALIRNAAKNQILLMKHRKNDREYWVVPGGGQEFGETQQECLKRELMEEMSIEIAVHRLIFMNESIQPDGKRHIVNLYYECDWLSGEIVLGEEERLAGWHFFSTEELNDLKIYPLLHAELVEYMRTGMVVPTYRTVPWTE